MADSATHVDAVRGDSRTVFWANVVGSMSIAVWASGAVHVPDYRAEINAQNSSMRFVEKR